ncbi:uncharacterized protein LOC142235250 [Haematobia irritans]|uniref:uncharacterized protein LOC142235250 n=1 Tax=Haematobia irritans TaxID=7368 RepID=UPI003F50605F
MRGTGVGSRPVEPQLPHVDQMRGTGVGSRPVEPQLPRREKESEDDATCTQTEQNSHDASNLYHYQGKTPAQRTEQNSPTRESSCSPLLGFETEDEFTTPPPQPSSQPASASPGMSG